MLIGFNLPISGPMATATDMARVAQLGEELGFDYLTLTDHIALPDVTVPGYPYSESGEFYSPDPGHRMEQLTAAAWIAAKTTKIRLVLAVMVVPHRPAILAAKMLTTIDVLSNGRLDVGIGAGWQKVEIDAVATTPFAERGAVTDEYLDAFRAVWTQKHVTFAGKYTHIDGLLVDPKPVQQPHPPIWVGGSGPRRTLPLVARYADVWHAWGSPNSLREANAQLDELAAAAGRDPSSIMRASSLSLDDLDTARKHAAKWRDAGYGYLVCGWPEAGRTRIDEFSREIMPEFSD